MLSESEVIKQDIRTLNLLGRGATGEVYLAEDSQNGIVAIKIFYPHIVADKTAMSRIAREVLIGTKIDHPNIVKYHQIIKSERQVALVMEYVKGLSLESLIENKGAFSVEKCLKFLSEMASGLQSFHSRALIHRDLIPANILISEAGVTKIADLGLAKPKYQTGENVIDPALATQYCTEVGQILGTPLYIAPECILGEVPDHRSDLYSLGLIGYYVLSGKLPFPSMSIPELLSSRITKMIPSLHELKIDCSQEVNDLFLKLVHFKPAERFQTAKELGDHLGRLILATEPIKVNVPTIESRCLTPKKRVKKTRVAKKRRWNSMQIFGFLAFASITLFVVNSPIFPYLHLLRTVAKYATSTYYSLGHFFK